MGCRVVATSEHHARVRRHLQVKFVENSFAFVDFAEFLVEVLSHVEGLHGLLVVPHIPNVHRKVISREQVVVTRRGKSSHADRIDDFCEEMLARGVLLELNLCRVLVELGRDSQVAQANVAFARGEEEHITTFGVVLHMCDYLRQLLYVGRL